MVFGGIFTFFYVFRFFAHKIFSKELKVHRLRPCVLRAHGVALRSLPENHPGDLV